MRKELSELDIAVTEGLSTFEVDESHPSWPALNDWIKKNKAVDMIQTKFSQNEIDNAHWLELIPDWHHGYPQPDEDSFGYLSETFDLSDYCELCGIGKQQKAPFQMKSEPRWGKRSVLQLNWVFDVYFTKPEVWKNYFEPLGITNYEVLDKNKMPLETVVQLVPTAEIDIETAGLEKTGCERCGRTKFLPAVKGPFPAIIGTPSAHLMKTRQYFGSGALAEHGVLVSAELAKVVRTNKLRGVSFRPVAEHDQHGS